MQKNLPEIKPRSNLQPTTTSIKRHFHVGQPYIVLSYIFEFPDRSLLQGYKVQTSKWAYNSMSWTYCAMHGLP